MKTLAFITLLALVSCQKQDLFPMEQANHTPIKSKVNYIGNPSFGPVVDTLNFHVYACNFDSVPDLTTIGYNVLIIKSYSGSYLVDSISTPMGIDQAHLQLGYNLDTTNDYRIALSEDSSRVKLRIMVSPHDTIKYYAHGYGLVMPANSLIHIADLYVKKVQGGYLYTKTWENPSYKPSPTNGAMSGCHIFKSINTVYLPRT